MSRLWLPSVTLWQREVVRFLRQRNRVVGALGTPLVFWVLIGSGLRRSVVSAGSGDPIDYLQYSFPGIIVLILLFTAIFANISIIEDRREGFLQAVLASPASRSAVVLGKVLGSTTLALMQAVVFLALTPLAGMALSWLSVAASVGVLTIVALELSALGFVVAWPMDSTQGFHAVMNLVLMPMWLLSGAFFPAGGASPWIRWIMAANPLTYGMAALRHAMYAGTRAVDPALPSPAVCLTVTIAFSALVFGLAIRAVARKA
ncbi:MAG: ABC transporter permease [Planctomycetes bacterium]|nr:ABC transporter permease [Planctomycetota bacterium]